MPARFHYLAERRSIRVLDRADPLLGSIEIDVDEQAPVVEDRGNRGGDADRAVGHLQKLRHDEGGGAHHRRHQLSAGRADRLNRGRLVARESRPNHCRDGDNADGEHVRYRAARNHAEQGGAHYRDLRRAAAEAAHGRHRDVREEIGAAGAGQHLAEDGERDHHEDGDLQDGADHAVDVEAKVSDEPLGRDPARLEISGQTRTDVDVDRHRQDDADEAEAGGTAARFQHEEQEDRAADDAFHRQHRELVGQRLVAHEDVSAQQERHDGVGVVEPACECAPARQEGVGKRQRQPGPQEQRDIERIAEAIGNICQDGDDGDRAGGIDRAIFALRFHDEGERERQTETNGQQLLGIERNVENLPGYVQHPEHDARDEQALQKIAEEDGRFRCGGGELLRARQ